MPMYCNQTTKLFRYIIRDLDMIILQKIEATIISLSLSVGLKKV